MRTAVAGGISAVLLAIGMPAASAGDPDYGRMWRADGVLRPGCHEYNYHYRVKPKKPDWGFETFLVDPDRETIASGGAVSDVDPKRGTMTFRFCRYNTRPGLFKIRGKLTIMDGHQQKVVWVEPGFFRLRRAS